MRLLSKWAAFALLALILVSPRLGDTQDFLGPIIEVGFLGCATLGGAAYKAVSSGLEDSRDVSNGPEEKDDYWDRKLRRAECGDPVSQRMAGIYYKRGEGGPPDYVAAYKWYSLASANGLQSATHLKAAVAELKTPEQIAEAERLVAEWQPKDCTPEQTVAPGV